MLCKHGNEWGATEQSNQLLNLDNSLDLDTILVTVTCHTLQLTKFYFSLKKQDHSTDHTLEKHKKQFVPPRRNCFSDKWFLDTTHTRQALNNLAIAGTDHDNGEMYVVLMNCLWYQLAMCVVVSALLWGCLKTLNVADRGISLSLIWMCLTSMIAYTNLPHSWRLYTSWLDKLKNSLLPTPAQVEGLRERTWAKHTVALKVESDMDATILKVCIGFTVIVGMVLQGASWDEVMKEIRKELR